MLRRIAFALLLPACMSPVEADELVLDEEEASAHVEDRWIPDAPPRPSTPPAVEPGAETPDVRAGPVGAAPRIVAARSEDDTDCYWHLTTRELPAIAEDGSVVAVTEAHVQQMSMFPGERDLVLAPVGDATATATRLVLYDDGDAIDADEAQCRKTLRRIRRRVATANEALAARAWRPLEALPVQRRLDETTDGLPASERPVQVVVLGRELVVRIPGVKVLARAPVPDDLPRARGVDAVDVDRQTGTVLVTYVYCDGESCTCDPRYRTAIEHWAPEVLAEIDARPCDPGDGDENACGPDTLF